MCLNLSYNSGATVKSPDRYVSQSKGLWGSLHLTSYLVAWNTLSGSSSLLPGSSIVEYGYPDHYYKWFEFECGVICLASAIP